jgi:hypothetical protein
MDIVVWLRSREVLSRQSPVIAIASLDRGGAGRNEHYVDLATAKGPQLMDLLQGRAGEGKFSKAAANVGLASLVRGTVSLFPPRDEH